MPDVSVSTGGMAAVNGLPTGTLYGKDSDLTALAHEAADLLLAEFGLDIQVRGNSDGKSVGAHFDGAFGFGLGAVKRPIWNDAIKFEAMFDGRPERFEDIRREVPIYACFVTAWGPPPTTFVASPTFDTLEDAL